MSSGEREQRHSRALEAELITGAEEKAEAEALNGLRQYDYAVQAIQEWNDRGNFKLRISLILSLHRQALQGISSYAGNFRPGAVEIKGSRHNPVPAHIVPEFVEDLCDYVNNNWDTTTAIHLAAYTMWRLNWIHPFADGNGRTARVLSFVVLSAKLKTVLPGTPTLPELIVDHRTQYEDALDAADDAWKREQIEVSKMEELLDGLLATQLAKVYELAGGQLSTGPQ